MNPQKIMRDALQGGMSALAARTLFSKRAKVRSIGFDVLSKHQPLLVCGSGSGESFIVKAGDQWIGRELFVSGSFDFDKFSLAVALAQQHRPGWKPETLIDVGANIGTICIPAVARGFAERAIAIEAEPDNARLLRTNVTLNLLQDRIECIHAAAGREDDATLTLETDPANFGDHRIRAKETDGAFGEATRNVVSVRSAKLDTLMKGVTVDRSLIWMDVQGYESNVLAGAAEMLKAKPVMVLEFGPYYMDRVGSFAEFCSALAGYSGFVDLNAGNELQPLSNLVALRESLTGTSFTDILVV